MCGFFRMKIKGKKVFALWRQLVAYITMFQINVLLKTNHFLNQEKKGQRNISLHVSGQENIHDLDNATQSTCIILSDFRQGRISLLDFFF